MSEYRSEIDGMRCIAVLPVVLFHAGLPPFSGGYVGVDVFFVISGYLITTILVQEMRAGTFTFTNFYERRARRILPALFFVTLVSIPFAWNWLLVREFKEFLQSVAAAALSVSNIFFWLKSDYFAQDAELLPLLHTWSLGVEEQFYIFFPFLLLLIPVRKSTTAIAILLGVLALSFIASILLIASHPMMVYFLLPFRAWELMVGAICAFIHLDYRRRGNEFAAIAGIGLVLLSMLVFDKTTVFPGWAALPPVLGTALVILFATSSTVTGRWLSMRPIVGIGLISYSLYLWHQPIFAFAHHYAPDPLTVAAKLSLIGLAFVLALFSWRFVERPFRRRNAGAILSRQRQIFAASIAGIVLFTLVGIAGDVTNGFPGRLSDVEARITNENGWSSHCMYTRSSPLAALPDPECIVNPGQPQKVALIGDSVMSSLSPILAEMFARHGYEVHQFTHSHCTLNTAFHRRNHNASPCPDFTRSVLDFVVRENFDVVVHAGNFIPFLSRADSDIVEAESGSPTSDINRVLADLSENAQTLSGNRILILPHQTPPIDVRQRALKQMRISGLLEDYSLDRLGSAGPSTQVSERMRSAIGGGWFFFDPNDVLCDKTHCNYVRDGIVMLSDDLHFTRDGAKLVSEELEKQLQRQGKL